MAALARSSLAVVTDHNAVHAILAGVGCFILAFVGYRVGPWIRELVGAQQGRSQLRNLAGPVLLCAFGVILVVSGLVHL